MTANCSSFVGKSGKVIAVRGEATNWTALGCDRTQANGMSRTIFSGFAALVLLGSWGGHMALAQVGVNGVQASGGLTTAAGATASPNPTTKAASEPAELAGMLVAQNDARARLGVPALTWSPEMTAKATATAKAAAVGSCSFTTTQKVGKAQKASMFWAAGLRRLGSKTSLQDISATYLVSRWREGLADYDVATGQCRTKSGNCEPFSHMVAPKAKAVGCARVICPNQAQVWACQYSE